MKKNKLLIPIMVLILVIGVVGGTLAWLTDKTDPVTNTFTVGDINITLDESPNLDLKMVPGYSIDKDPVITVDSDSEKCYVFVKVEEKGVTYMNENEEVTIPFSNYISYKVSDDWTKLEGVEGVDNVWYQIIEPNGEESKLGIIGYETDDGFIADKVLVNDTVTKGMLDKAANDNPTLKFTAYAIQYMKDNNNYFEPADAWAELNK